MRVKLGFAQKVQGVANVAPEIIPEEPVAGFVEAFLSFGDIAEGAVGAVVRFFFAETFRAQTFDFGFNVRGNLLAEVAGLSVSAEWIQRKHVSGLLGFQNATDCRCEALPLGGFLG